DVKACLGSKSLDTIEWPEVGLAQIDPPAWREKVMDLVKKPLMQGAVAIPSGGFDRFADGMRRKRWIHGNDAECLPQSNSCKEIGFPDFNPPRKLMQLNILFGGMHRGRIDVQRQDCTGSGIGGYNGDDPGAGTEIEHAILWCDRPMPHERYT